ncbi:MAG: hypothetical protein RMK80_08650 [Pseudobdellovibrionaceae bacterium]|nr:hypothetical protein [Pseudobdellovibrionaceae bacterium]
MKMIKKFPISFFVFFPKLRSLLLSLLLIFGLLLYACEPSGVRPSMERSPKQTDPSGRGSKGDERALQEGSFNLRQLRYHFVKHFYVPRLNALMNETRDVLLLLETFSPSDGDLLRLKFSRIIKNYFNVVSLPTGAILENNGAFLQETWSYPYLNQCGIDQDMARYFFTGELPKEFLATQKGLLALDYLLFYQGDGTFCRRRLSPDLERWLTLSSQEKRRARRQWARIVLQDFLKQVEGVRLVWLGENYQLDWIFKGKEEDLLRDWAHWLLALESHREKYWDVFYGNSNFCRKNREVCEGRRFLHYSDLGWVAWQGLLETAFYVLVGARSEGEESIASRPLQKHKGLLHWLSDRGHSNLVKDLGEEVGKLQGLWERAGEQYPRLMGIQGDFGQLRCDGGSASPSVLHQSEKETEIICQFGVSLRRLVRLIKVDLFVSLSLVYPPTHQGDND